MVLFLGLILNIFLINKNFIKAHTCFNRIDLPNFTNKEELKKSILFMVENQDWGFGME